MKILIICLFSFIFTQLSAAEEQPPVTPDMIKQFNQQNLSSIYDKNLSKEKISTWGSRYCIAFPKGREVFCQGCWSIFGGEGGRVDCAVRVGGSSCATNGCQVYYGGCEEQRNLQFCNRITD